MSDRTETALGVLVSLWRASGAVKYSGKDMMIEILRRPRLRRRSVQLSHDAANFKYCGFLSHLGLGRGFVVP